MRKFQNIISKLSGLLGIFLILLIWGAISALEIVPKFMLPNPMEVLQAFVKDFRLIITYLGYTLLEALIGFTISIILGFFIAVFMDRFRFFEKITYPIIVMSQTIPTIVIAPLIVLWFGFGVLPKIILIFLTCFFPITISILSGFKSVDKDLIRLMDSMNFTYLKTLIFVKIPYSLKDFFSGLKISATYAIVGAVVAEWLGGEAGVGVYMIRVKKAYSFDKMFASIIAVSLLSVCLIWLIKFLEKKIIYWKQD